MRQEGDRRVRKLLLRCGVSLVTVLAAGGLAFAQNNDNEAWTAQVGETNSLSIVQTGNRNLAGADTDELLIDQHGSFNVMLIDQFGYDNKVGTVPAEDRLDADIPSGINQYGNWNTLELRQTNSVLGDFNLVGAVLQQSRTDNQAIANQLLVVQADGAAAPGSAGHSVEGIRQKNLQLNATPNSIVINQDGGGLSLGHDYLLAVQEGAGNLLDSIQSGQSNSIGETWQVGDVNELVLRQSEGVGNELLRVQQYGDLNKSRVTQTGSLNYVDLVYQNNATIAISGNTVTIVQAGDGNGGSGLGGIGAFADTGVAKLMSVAQATVTQIGDDNDVSYVAYGDVNLFGFWQDGEGNGITGVVGRQGVGQEGLRNEQAVWMEGDDNDLKYWVYGSDNDAGLRFEGERNVATLEQDGVANVALVRIDGDDNNGAGPLLGVALLTPASTLLPGTLQQIGEGNSLDIDILGDLNSFVVKQAGDNNATDLDVTGSDNQAAISQAANLDSATVRQSGTGNLIGVVQF
jgi:hypothetical protein